MAELKEEEKELANWTLQKFKDAMTAKDPYVVRWMEYLNAWNNTKYEESSSKAYKSNYVSNFIYSTIESIRPILFDGNPKFEALPLTIDAKQYSDDINDALDWEFKRENVQSKLISNAIYTLVTGNSMFMLPYTFNDKPNSDVDGNVSCIPVSIFNIFPDPLATSMDDAEYIIYATYQHINKLKQQYPDKADFIEASNIQYSELVNDRNKDAKVNNQVLVLEVWCRDYTTIEVEEEDGSTSKKPQYPLGRVITTAPELSVVFEDKENPYQTGKFPFFLFKDIDVPFQFWGEGEVKWLLSPQQARNDLTNQVIDNAKHTANAQWIIDKNAGIPQGTLTNRPGLIIRKNPGSSVDRATPPSMPMYVSEAIARLDGDMEVVSGIHDVTRGQTPTGIESGSAILALQEAGQTRIRLKAKLLELSLAELGTEWLERMKQFWKFNRLIPVKKDVTQTAMNPQMNGMELQPTMLNTQETVFDFVEVSNDKALAQSYKVVVIGSASMQVNRASMLDVMIQLANTPAEDGLPMVTREAVLDYLPNVNKKVILQYFDKLKQEQMMQQQQTMMNNEQVQQLQMLQEQTSEVGNAVGSVQQRLQKEDEAKARDELMGEGYQAGMNEAMAVQQMQSKSGGVPDDLLKQMSNMDDNELEQLLAQNPELINSI